jgi:Rad3-related DNA helicase
VGRALDLVRRRWRALARETPAAEAAAPNGGWRMLDEPPAALLGALHKAVAAIGEHLAEQPPGPDGPLQALWFDALRLLRLAETFGPHSMFDLQDAPGGGSTLCLRNVVPAGFLAPRFAAARTAALFSATLQPQQYFRDMLGLPPDTAWLEVGSPFDPAQLTVHVDRGLSTRWRDRDASLDRVVERIARQYAARPGNYLAFFGGYDYMERVAAAFRARHAGVPAWQQSRGMSEAQQAAFLARFEDGGRGIAFAVLGGSFGEGVDLPGDRLVGAFIATLGMPAASPLNEEIRRRLGFDYTYLVPGLQKVVQAAGRVIRTPQDRGVLHLLDERYGQRAVRALLPRWWGLDGPPMRGPGNTA